MQLQENKNIYDLYWIFLSLIITYFLFPVFVPPSAGLDASYMVGLNLGIEKKLIFGEEIIFTYGPLGFLATRLPIEIPNWFFPIFDVSLISGLCYSLACFFRRLPLHKAAITILALIILTTLSQQFSDVTFLLFFLFLYFIFSGSYAKLAIAGIIAIISFYIKLNTGIIMLLLYIPAVLYFFISRHINSKQVVILTAAFLVSLFSSAFLLNTSLAAYISSSFELISGHNETMWLDVHTEGTVLYLHLGLLTCAMYLFTFGIYFYRYGLHFRNSIVAGSSAFFLFILFKTGFVRADIVHINSFFSFAILPALLFYSFAREDKKLLLYLLIIPVATLSFTITGIHKIRPNLERISKFATYAEVLFKGDEVLSGNIKMPVGIMFPQVMKTTAGNAGFDIFPWDISLLYFNNLNFKQRPVMQTYYAYTQKLDSINAESLSNEKAPAFLLYTHKTIDNRYGFHEEPMTKLAITNNYFIADFYNNYFLLKKRKSPVINHLKEIKNDRSTFNNSIEIPETEQVLIADIDIDYSFYGRVYKYLFQPPQLYITITLENGKTHTFRALKPLLKNGIIINKFIDDNTDANLFFQQSGKANKNIRSIRFSSPQIWGFKEEIKYKLRKIDYEITTDTNTEFTNTIRLDTTDKLFIKSTKTDSLHYLQEGFADNAGFKSFSVRILNKNLVFPSLFVELKEQSTNNSLYFKTFTSDISNVVTASLNQRQRPEILPGNKFSFYLNGSALPSGKYKVIIHLQQTNTGEYISADTGREMNF